MRVPTVVTLGDVARRAGVSLATASRVLNGSTRRVNEDLREVVLQAAGELGYTPNLHAQAIARGTSATIGLVVHDIADPYFSAIASGVMRVADERGLIVTLGTTLRNPNREVQYLSMLRAQRARAVILIGSRITDKEQTGRLANEVQAFRKAGGHIACVSQHKLPADTVLPENRAGARELATQLADLGHKRFVVLGGPKQLLTARDRVQGFKDGLRSKGIELPAEAILDDAFTRDGGYEATKQLLSRKHNYTCLFAVNDVMAVGAMAACRELGFDVPGDLSIAGFDDIETLRDLTPSLTTVRLPLEDMGARAAELALELEEPESAERVERVERVEKVRGEVILRESTRKVRSR